MADTPWLRYADFAGRVGERFALSMPDGAELPLTVAEVVDTGRTGGAGPDGETREQFSVVFRGPREPVLEQGIRELRHDDLGELALFLVPVAADEGGTSYEAAFG